VVSLSELRARRETLFHGKERQGSLRAALVTGAAGTFTLKVVSTGLSLLTSLFLARLLGAAGYGAYAYAISWVGLLSVPALLGLDNLFIREIAAYKVRSEWDLMSGLLHWANLVTLLISLGLALVAAIGAWILAEHVESQMVFTLWIALMMIPLIALTRLRQAALQGLGHVVVGQLPEVVIRRLLFIVFVGVVYSVLGADLTAPWAVSMDVLAAGVALFLGVGLLHKTLPRYAQEASPVYQTRVWARSMLPLLFISVIQAISGQVALVLLGMIKGAEAVGIYAVAQRSAALITFALFAVNAVLSPTVASLYAAGDMKRLQRVVTKSARIILFASVPMVISLFVFGDRFLLYFGPEFASAKMSLFILSAGQLANAAMGSVGLLLIMTGHERDTSIVFGGNALLTVLLNVILIPKWGIEGAATAGTSGMIIWNLLLAALVYKRLGIDSTALGTMSLWREP
jgi:O-antigen/teichoic acid export membrane protein